MPPLAVDLHDSLSEPCRPIDIARLVKYIVHASQLRGVSSSISH